MVRAEVHGIVKEYEEGTTYEVIAKDFQKDYDSTIALVFVNGKLTELMKKMYKDAKLEFVTYGESAGHKSYVRTATLVLMKAASDILGMEAAADLKVEFAIGTGYYCSFTDGRVPDEDLVSRIKARMDEIVSEKIPITEILQFCYKF